MGFSPLPILYPFLYQFLLYQHLYSIPLTNATGVQLVIVLCTALAWLIHMGFCLLPILYPFLYSWQCHWRATYNTVHSTGMVDTHGFLPLTYTLPITYKSIPTVQCNTKWHATCYNTVCTALAWLTHTWVSPPLTNTLPKYVSYTPCYTVQLAILFTLYCTVLVWLTHMGFSLLPMVTPLPHQPYVIATSITSIT